MVPTMKLYIRCKEGKETQCIEAAENSSLVELRALIATRLSPPVSPSSIRLSLNDLDELVPNSPTDSLNSPQLKSGDHLYLWPATEYLTSNFVLDQRNSMDGCFGASDLASTSTAKERATTEAAPRSATVEDREAVPRSASVEVREAVPRSPTSPQPPNRSPNPIVPTMMLYIRCKDGGETQCIEAAEHSSLLELRALIATRLSPPVSPTSIRLSVNDLDELVPNSPTESLTSLQLKSDDHLFLWRAPEYLTSNIVLDQTNSMDGCFGASVSALPSSVKERSRTDAVPRSAPVDVGEEESRSATVEEGEAVPRLVDDGEEVPTSAVEELEAVPRFASVEDQEAVPRSSEEDKMVPDSPPIRREHRLLSLFNDLLKTEQWQTRGGMGRLVLAVHAVFLHYGFVVSKSSSLDGSGLPEGWASAPSPTVAVNYTVPLLGDKDDTNLAIVKLSNTGNFVSIYAYICSAEDVDVYRMCLDLSRENFYLSDDTGNYLKDALELFMNLGGGLAQPVLIDFCTANGLRKPHRFTDLPDDLVTEILKLLDCFHVVTVGCVSKYLMRMASDNQLWKGRFQQEFWFLKSRSNLEGKNWKEKFVNCRVKTNFQIRIEAIRSRKFHWDDQLDYVTNVFTLPALTVNQAFAPQSITLPMIWFGSINPLQAKIGFPRIPDPTINFLILKETPAIFDHNPGTIIGYVRIQSLRTEIHGIPRAPGTKVEFFTLAETREVLPQLHENIIKFIVVPLARTGIPALGEKTIGIFRLRGVSQRTKQDFPVFR